MTLVSVLTAVLLLLGIDPVLLTTDSTSLSDQTEASAPAPAECPTILGCGSDRDAAMEFEAKVVDNLWYGLALPIDYATAERTPGDVRAIAGQWGDAGLWSGTYLGAESYRYAVARHHLASTPTGQDGLGNRKYWVDQLKGALTRIDALVAQIDLRTYIARDWHTELDPSIDPATLPPSVNLGGGVIQGEPGMLMFSCAPTAAPPGFGMAMNSDVRGPWRWVNDLGRPERLTLPQGTYVCEASTTRDAYAGTLFGLMNAFDLVAPDDPELRAVIRDDILAIANFLLKNGWNTTRPHGQVALPPFGDVYDNFATPTMILSPAYRLAISEAALHVAQVAGPPEEAQKWQAIWAEELATQTPSDTVANELNDPTPQAGYFGWNLAHLMYSTMIRLAPDETARALFRRNFSIIDRQTGDDDNAFFETVAFSITGEQWRHDAAVAHTRAWLDYRRRIDGGGVTSNSARCGATLECVPADEFDITTETAIGSATVTYEGSSTRPRSITPVPVADRVPTDFLWQRSPFTELDGSVDATHQEPGIDFLLPYWMMRYHTEVSIPALDPLDPWPGPSYSGT